MKIAYQSFVNTQMAAPYLSRLSTYLGQIKAPGTEIILKELDPPDTYAHPVMEYRCGMQALNNALAAGREGVDAVVFGHFQDAGLAEAKAALNIPVLGLGETSMLFACTLARKFALVTINPRFIPYHEEQIARYGLEKRVTGVRALQFEPGEFTAGFDDPAKLQAAIDSLAEQSRPLVAAGAEIIIPAGGIPMLASSLATPPDLDGARILNGIPVLIKFAEMAAELKRLNGWHISRSGAFPELPEEVAQSCMDLFR